MELERQKYVLTNEGLMEEYLGIMISHNNDGSYEMSQPLLIDRIIESIPGMVDARSFKTPAYYNVVLTKNVEGESRKEQWNYMSVIGMLNYLVSCTHPEISFAVHQCARFCNDTKRMSRASSQDSDPIPAIYQEDHSRRSKTDPRHNLSTRQEEVN